MVSLKRAMELMERSHRQINQGTIHRVAPDPGPDEWRAEAERIRELACSNNPEDVDEAIRRSKKMQRIFTMPPRPPRAQRPQCTATTRKGERCKARAWWPPGEPAPKKVCRIHGGLSTGPRTDAGKAAIAESNRRRARKEVTQ